MFGQPSNTGEFFKQLFLSKTVLSRLLLINTAVFIVVQLIETLAWLAGADNSGAGVAIGLVAEYFALPSDLNTLIFKPWTFFTYMFLHEGFFHLLFNMVMLYFGSRIFLEYLGPRKLLRTYILGGLMGALFFIISFNLFPLFSDVKGQAVALGASASVLAIIIAISTYVPNYTVQLLFIGRVKMKYVAIVFVAIDLLSMRQGNAGGHIAHLGGAFWGFVYAYMLRNGNDLTSFLNNFKLPKFTYHSKPSANFKASRPQNKRSFSDDEYNANKAAQQEEIDEILDKISKSGYSSLSKKEKELLFKSSNKK